MAGDDYLENRFQLLVAAIPIELRERLDRAGVLTLRLGPEEIKLVKQFNETIQHGMILEIQELATKIGVEL